MNSYEKFDYTTEEERIKKLKEEIRKLKAYRRPSDSIFRGDNLTHKYRILLMRKIIDGYEGIQKQRMIDHYWKYGNDLSTLEWQEVAMGFRK